MCDTGLVSYNYELQLEKVVCKFQPEQMDG